MTFKPSVHQYRRYELIYISALLYSVSHLLGIYNIF